MKGKIRFEIASKNGKSRCLHLYLSEDKFIGSCTLIYEKKIHEGIMVFTEVIEERELRILTREIQNGLLLSKEEELYIQVYYGIYSTLVCDESEEIWDKILKEV